jgi:UDPglucose 6-dehydrogenase
VKIGIIGHGYVGKGMERLFSGAYEIAVFDILHQPDDSVLSGSDLILICAPTPPDEDGLCDVSMVFDAAERADAIAPDALVCIKSAVPPGTTDTLNRKFKGERFHVSPEYMGELPNFTPAWAYPDPQDARSHDFVIVGGPRAGEVLDFFQRVMATTARYMACQAIEAELVKRLENAFFATKVTFCNEAAKIVQANGADWHSVRELWLLDPRIGRSHTAVFPDRPGFGGKCLPKDLSALIAEAQSAGVDATLLKAVRDTNDRIRGGSA